MKKIALLAGTFALAATSSFNVSAGPNPFSDCGIGAALFKDTKWAAVSSNIIWDIGLTAITSATASPETCSAANVETAKFIIDNYDNLAENIAEGEGEHLNAMYDIVNIEKDSHQAITAQIRKQMAETVSSDNYQALSLKDKASKLYEIVNTTTSAS